MKCTRTTREIEEGLEQYRPGQWLRLTLDEMKGRIPQQFVAGWRISLPLGSLQLNEVDHLLLVIDSHFPSTQPRVFAPSAGSEYRWPHVEQNGLLCLRPSRLTASIASRILIHLNDAEELLNYSEDTRQEEFEREFLAYWAHRATQSSERSRVLSLVTPKGDTREICCFYDSRSSRYIVGDDKGQLKRWLQNTGINPRDKDIFTTWLFRLSRPWAPNEFPEVGRDITKLLPPDAIRHCLTPGINLPFVFEVDTATGPAFASVVLQSPSLQQVIKGFRHISRVPANIILNSYANLTVERCKVSRCDASWVHGRDHPSSHVGVKNRKVAIVGCGSIGAAVARILAQAGVGQILLVDGDSLSTANASRHILGVDRQGFNKALSVQIELQRQFPHLIFDYAFPKRFEILSDKELGHIADVDLIIAAGIDFDGEATLDAWRRQLPQPPAYLSTWVEAYAAAGHAVLLFGNSSILTGFDEEERPVFRLTDWAEEAGAMIVEAGCGNSFQPHGIVDLHPTIGIAASLALETLLDKIPVSCRRVWMGDPSSVEKNGGALRESFTEKQKILEFPWT